jgi:hypothetical protein
MRRRSVSDIGPEGGSWVGHQVRGPDGTVVGWVVWDGCAPASGPYGKGELLDYSEVKRIWFRMGMTGPTFRTTAMWKRKAVPTAVDDE